MKLATSTISNGSMVGLKSKIPAAYANLDKFLKKNNLLKENIAIMDQVHGNSIRNIDKSGYYTKTDGLIVTNPSISIVIYHADCIPLFFYYDDLSIFGGVHAGWKGIQLGIIESMVKQLSSNVSENSDNLKVVSGPFICADHYDILHTDKRVDLFPTIQLKNNRLGLDLRTEVANRLLELGIKKENISLSKDCTACQSNKYWSHHIQQEKVGLMVSVFSLH